MGRTLARLPCPSRLARVPSTPRSVPAQEADPMHGIYVDVLVVVGAIVAIGLLTMSELAVGTASMTPKLVRTGEIEPPPLLWASASIPNGCSGPCRQGRAPGNPGRRIWRSDLGSAGRPGHRKNRPPGAVSPKHRPFLRHSGDHAHIAGRRQSRSSEDRAFSSGTNRPDLVPADSRGLDCRHADRRVLEPRRPILRCGPSVFARLMSRQSLRKRSRCCCRKAPKQACSKRASTR